MLLIDADLHEPSLHDLFGLPPERGLTTLLTGPDSPLEAVMHVTQQPGLRVVPSGPLPPNPGDLLSSERMRDTVAQLAARYDLLIIDSPALPAVLDAATLASFVQGTLVVVDSATADRSTLVQVRDALHVARADVLGTVLFRQGRSSEAAHPAPSASGDVAPAGTRSQADRSGPL